MSSRQGAGYRVGVGVSLRAHVHALTGQPDHECTFSHRGSNTSSHVEDCVAAQPQALWYCATTQASSPYSMSAPKEKVA